MLVAFAGSGMRFQFNLEAAEFDLRPSNVIGDSLARRCIFKTPPMDVYERRTRDVIELFLSRRISSEDCVAALDAALC